jgi:wyosine [tRNA(Phe)-imidazoG37] synthetase (radical SAM superfamily)
MDKDAGNKVNGVVSNIIFGPIDSRRYGVSLGVNLLPSDVKVCCFNCPYCECGWTEVQDLAKAEVHFPTRERVAAALEERLIDMQKAGRAPDAITYAGNGEPTMHPEFLAVSRDCARLRDQYAPKAKLVLLSNSATLGDDNVQEALALFDQRVLKLDCALPDVFKRLNSPLSSCSLEKIIDDLAELSARMPIVLQSMFIEGQGANTDEAAVDAWIAVVARIKPQSVQIYSIERVPAASGVKAVEPDKLQSLARRLSEATGVVIEVF